MHNLEWTAKYDPIRRCIIYKTTLIANERKWYDTCAVEAQALDVCIDHDKVMTNVGGKDGACAAAIHGLKPMTSWD